MFNPAAGLFDALWDNVAHVGNGRRADDQQHAAAVSLQRGNGGGNFGRAVAAALFRLETAAKHL